MLLDLCSHLKTVEITLIHFNHELRGAESDADEDFVRELGEKYGFSVHVIRENIKKYAIDQDLSIEEAGSIRRKQAFLKILDKIQYDMVLTGHHKDDQIETILINLYSGTGIQGLAGTSHQNKQMLRPLLNTTRSEIMDYARAKELRFCQDHTNMDIKYLRNNIRTELIPNIRPQKASDLYKLIQDIADQGNKLNKMVEQSVEHYDNIDIRYYSNGKISLGLNKLADYFSPIKKAIFDRAFRKISSLPQGLSAKHYSALSSLVSEGTIGQEIHLPASIAAYRDRKQLTFIRKSAFKWENISLVSSEKKAFPFFSFHLDKVNIHKHISNPDYFWYEDIKDDYTFKMAVDGDKMIIDNAGRTKSVKQILQEAYLAPHLKAFFPVLELNGHVVWIPGIRTAATAFVELDSKMKSKIAQCIKVQFDEGTFE